MFSYVFLFWSLQAAGWRLERHHFCDACYPLLFVSKQRWWALLRTKLVYYYTFKNSSPWHCTYLCSTTLYLWLLLCGNNKRCWKLKTFDMYIKHILTLRHFVHTTCICIYMPDQLLLICQWPHRNSCIMCQHVSKCMSYHEAIGGMVITGVTENMKLLCKNEHYW